MHLFSLGKQEEFQSERQFGNLGVQVKQIRLGQSLSTFSPFKEGEKAKEYEKKNNTVNLLDCRKCK